MPVDGELYYNYGRQYRFVKPYDTDPGTYRLATPESGARGGDAGAPVEINSINPVQTETKGSAIKLTTVSIDIATLENRLDS